jgi:folylpolyglutamate synthase/dihydropteroate synthase
VAGVAPAASVTAAVDDLVRTVPAGSPRRIVIFGSLYLAGTVLADHG